jgi:hypothetical protein
MPARDFPGLNTMTTATSLRQGLGKMTLPGTERSLML